ncbi:putative tRNA (uracil-O(2)-)-methyltransferase [Nibea albiflora]|uniref:tRNA (Uracil-O(2)-)-methyltransferase n=1 Tax=Nibea albiflora TaxID=240163 RepID=A0ACB7EV93_NIBAL|nr:putative tRNA (uracil-O(2)-)-methyltransferase [Nibea albiflora]
MPRLFDIKFPGECKTLPDGFWSAVDVWIQKPHVVNKRLCGVKDTEGEHAGTEAVQFLLDDPELSHEVFSFLSRDVSPAHTHTHTQDKPWTSSVRTIIPKVNCYGTNLHKELILKDFGRQRVTFLPFEEDSEGRACLKRGNVYQIQLLHQDCEEWALELHALTPDAWFSDGVAYPKLPWLSSDLLPKLVRWAAECKSSEFKSTLSLLPVEKYSVMYQQLKEKYKAMVKVWPEVTDPEKFVYEDVAIATYLLVLWAEERAEKNLTARQSFVDLGCGNGLLVHILTNEGHPGKGIDVRKRKIWDMYGPQTLLEFTSVCFPRRPPDGNVEPQSENSDVTTDDDLSSYACRYFVLPCCFFDFYGKYQRRQCKKSQYKEYIDFIAEVSQFSGFNTEEDCLRIPSTKRVGSRSSLSVSEVAGLLEQETLQRLKKECGGLQTLLKNNHQVFRVEGGRVHIRDWRDRKSSRADTKRKPVAPGALKTRPCWFYDHHPQRCPLQAEHCAFAHGPDDLRPSTKPRKKIKNDAL